jgi:hypothetical protein
LNRVILNLEVCDCQFRIGENLETRAGRTLSFY